MRAPEIEQLAAPALELLLTPRLTCCRMAFPGMCVLLRIQGDNRGVTHGHVLLWISDPLCRRRIISTVFKMAYVTSRSVMFHQ